MRTAHVQAACGSAGAVGAGALSLAIKPRPGYAPGVAVHCFAFQGHQQPGASRLRDRRLRPLQDLVEASKRNPRYSRFGRGARIAGSAKRGFPGHGFHRTARPARSVVNQPNLPAARVHPGVFEHGCSNRRGASARGQTNPGNSLGEALADTQRLGPGCLAAAAWLEANRDLA